MVKMGKIFYDACKNGNVKQVMYMIENGLIKSNEFENGLFGACEGRNLYLCVYVFEKARSQGIDINFHKVDEYFEKNFALYSETGRIPDVMKNIHILAFFNKICILDQKLRKNSQSNNITSGIRQEMPNDEAVLDNNNNQCENQILKEGLIREMEYKTTFSQCNLPLCHPVNKNVERLYLNNRHRETQNQFRQRSFSIIKSIITFWNFAFNEKMNWNLCLRFITGQNFKLVLFFVHMGGDVFLIMSPHEEHYYPWKYLILNHNLKYKKEYRKKYEFPEGSINEYIETRCKIKRFTALLLKRYLPFFLQKLLIYPFIPFPHVLYQFEDGQLVTIIDAPPLL